MRFARKDTGASMLGYGLVVGLIGVVALSAIDKIGEQSELVMCGAADAIGTVTGAGCAPSPLPSPDSLLAFGHSPSLATTQGQTESSCQIMRVYNRGESDYASGALTFTLAGADADKFAFCKDVGYTLIYSKSGQTNVSSVTSNTTLFAAPYQGHQIGLRLIAGHSGNGSSVETRQAQIVVTASDGMQATTSISGNSYNDDRPIAAFVGQTGPNLGYPHSSLPASRCHNVTVTNIGTATANAVSFTIGGPDAQGVSNCNWGCTGSLAPGASCPYGFQVTYDEVDVIEQLVITANFDNGASIATVQSNTYASGTPQIGMRLGGTSNSYSYFQSVVGLGTLTNNNTGPCIDIEMYNNGLGSYNLNPLPLTWQSTTAPAGSSFQSCTPSTNECGESLAVGGTCRIGVQHIWSGSTPQAGGVYQQFFRIRGDGNNKRVTFSLNIP